MNRSSVIRGRRKAGLMTVLAAAAVLLLAVPVHADVIRAAGQSTESGGPGTANTAGVIVETSAVFSEDAPKQASVEGMSATPGTVAGQQSAGETEEVVQAVPPAGAVGTVAGANAGGPKVVTNSLFNGGELMMLSPDSASQMESFLITTKSGKLIMIDGGTENETEHLKQVLQSKGGHVSAWLITHPTPIMWGL